LSVLVATGDSVNLVWPLEVFALRVLQGKLQAVQRTPAIPVSEDSSITDNRDSFKNILETGTLR
jgi:hypothetical protein